MYKPQYNTNSKDKADILGIYINLLSGFLPDPGLPLPGHVDLGANASYELLDPYSDLKYIVISFQSMNPKKYQNSMYKIHGVSQK